MYLLWVKLHNILLVAFNREGISRIASLLGVPKKMDSCTSATCDNLWGRTGFAKVLIDIWATAELKRTIDVVIPDLDGKEDARQRGFYASDQKEWVPKKAIGTIDPNDVGKQMEEGETSGTKLPVEPVVVLQVNNPLADRVPDVGVISNTIEVASEKDNNVETSKNPLYTPAPRPGECFLTKVDDSRVTVRTKSAGPSSVAPDKPFVQSVVNSIRTYTARRGVYTPATENSFFGYNWVRLESILIDFRLFSELSSFSESEFIFSESESMFSESENHIFRIGIYVFRIGKYVVFSEVFCFVMPFPDWKPTLFRIGKLAS
ncbi:hypothetical protein OSB04_024028 [Centaurea solstitialis]|uniref:DUF4283 domain-containing protein n=1 Tax=Centaurea solstitialis TaxID=347529 RepID=A0AA38SYQ3_9ASTR|nr:hypothetical protein OSB04_024028 [Centaurea solstitialis]